MDDNTRLTSFLPIADSRIVPASEFSASDLKNHGRVLDAADKGEAIRIMRRQTPYILVREDSIAELATRISEKAPRSLAEMLAGFTPQDAEEMRRSAGWWRSDFPVGKEIL